MALELVFSQEKQIQLDVLLKDRVFSVSCCSPLPLSCDGVEWAWCDHGSKYQSWLELGSRSMEPRAVGKSEQRNDLSVLAKVTTLAQVLLGNGSLKQDEITRD